MPRTKKIIPTSEEKIMDEKAPKVKQMVRWLSGSTDDAGHEAATQVDAELTSWIDQGYRLFATHYVGNDGGAVGVLYILVAD